MTPAEFWKEALRTHSNPIVIDPRAAQAFELCKTLTLKQVGPILGVKSERIRNLRDQHTAEIKREEGRVREVNNFLNGVTKFEALHIKALGDMSVKLENTLDRLGVSTIDRLMRVTKQKFLMQRGAGRTQFKELNELLALFGAGPLT